MERPHPKDNERLRADVDAARRIAVKPQLRPDLRFRELLTLWNEEKALRPQSYVEMERATEDLIDYLGDIPVESFTSDIHHSDGSQFEPMAADALNGASHQRRACSTIARTHRIYGSSHSVRGSDAWRDAGSHRAGRHRYGARDWRPMSCAG